MKTLLKLLSGTILSIFLFNNCGSPPPNESQSESSDMIMSEDEVILKIEDINLYNELNIEMLDDLGLHGSKKCKRIINKGAKYAFNFDGIDINVMDGVVAKIAGAKFAPALYPQITSTFLYYDTNQFEECQKMQATVELFKKTPHRDVQLRLIDMIEKREMASIRIKEKLLSILTAKTDSEAIEAIKQTNQFIQQSSGISIGETPNDEG